MISVEEALERILAEITPLPLTEVPLPESVSYTHLTLPTNREV